VIREVERVADGLWLVAHDPTWGRPRVGRRVLGIGLAAALLGELVVGGFALVAAGRVEPTALQPYLRRIRHHPGGFSIMGSWCTSSHQPVSVDQAGEPCWLCQVRGVERFPDTLVWSTRQLIARERVRPVADWLTVLAPQAPAMVAERLAEDGWLTSAVQRRWLRGDVRVWTPNNLVEADMPRSMLLRIAEDVGARPGRQQLLLAGLVGALGLTRMVVADLEPDDRLQATRALAATTARLDAPLRYLVEQAQLVADSRHRAHLTTHPTP
jgi:hypothetical protein